MKNPNRLSSFSGKHPFVYEYVYYQNRNQTKSNFHLKVQKQKIYGREYLFNPKCFEFKNQFDSSKFTCLNKCFLEFAFELALDNSKDAKKFDLEEIIDIMAVNASLKIIEQISIQLTNSRLEIPKSSKENIEFCFKKCNKTEDCFQETYNVISLGEAYAKAYFNDQIQIDLVSTIYKACFSTTHFFLQFFGLLTRKTSVLIYETRQSSRN